MKGLSNKAKSYLQKCQDGALIDDSFGNTFGSDTYNTATYNPQLALMQPISPLPNSLQKNYQQSLIDKQKQDKSLLDNLKQSTVTAQPSQTQQDANTIGNVLSQVNPLIQVGIGATQLFQAKQQRKAAKEKEKMYKEEMKKRAEADRLEGYYQTPYTSFQKGGLVDPNLDLFSQFYDQQTQANQDYTQSLQNYYDQVNDVLKNQYQTTQKQGQANLVQGVGSTVSAIQKVLTGMKDGGFVSRYRNRMRVRNDNRFENRDRNRMQDGGIDSVDSLLLQPKSVYPSIPYSTDGVPNLTGWTDQQIQDYAMNMEAMHNKIYNDIAQDKVSTKKLSKVSNLREKQEGGNIEGTDDTLDIYSENFDAAKFKDQGTPGNPQTEQDKTQEVLSLDVSKANQDAQEGDSLINWIFQDEEPNYSPIEEEYNNGSSNDSNNTNMDSGNVVDKIAQNESGGDYSVVNPNGGATGKYQFMPVWAGQIKDFMGLPRETSKDQVMQEFRNNPEAQDQFMNHVVEDIYKPIVNDLRPLAKKYGFNDDQMVKMLHYRGEADTRRRLRTGNFELNEKEKSYYHNPEILDYLNK